MVKWLIRLEGLTVFIAAIALYNKLHGDWLVFLLLLFTPDISMVGYLINPKIGAIIYNLVHTYLLALGLIAVGLYTNLSWLILYGCILAAHIGLDRLLGFGLKYSTNFKDTHLQHL